MSAKASPMFIMILMKSRAAQKRRERQEDGKSKHGDGDDNNSLHVSVPPFIPLLLLTSSPPLRLCAELLNVSR